jgi:hypothetical protein
MDMQFRNHAPLPHFSRGPRASRPLEPALKSTHNPSRSLASDRGKDKGDRPSLRTDWLKTAAVLQGARSRVSCPRFLLRSALRGHAAADLRPSDSVLNCRCRGLAPVFCRSYLNAIPMDPAEKRYAPFFHAQQPGAQQLAGLMARTKALTNFPFTCDAIASTSTPFSLRKRRASSI